ncbi:MAG: hypothetical protein KKD17_03425 [Nanoarchaeota archaeon]|nr:hypothetical protein [Nanoarchaeota archaeon]
MDEISNKTLATLLVVAIVISLAGTFFAMRGVSQVTNIISGAQTATGTAKVNISEQTSITLIKNTVDFGTGRRDSAYATDSECNLTSSQPIPSCWNDTGSNYLANSGDFQVENDGNVPVNVTINGTVSADFFNSCTTTTIIGGDPQYMFSSADPTTGGGCQSGNQVALANFTGSPQRICGNLTTDTGDDRVNVTIELRVPSGPAGECEDEGVKFTALRNY